ncbi:MAG: hypothetical protein K0S45_3641 [Nitrospira sp.]|nr:hypothetical protein [Nitrospira sp.]
MCCCVTFPIRSGLPALNAEMDCEQLPNELSRLIKVWTSQPYFAGHNSGFAQFNNAWPLVMLRKYTDKGTVD